MQYLIYPPQLTRQGRWVAPPYTEENGGLESGRNSAKVTQLVCDGAWICTLGRLVSKPTYILPGQAQTLRCQSSLGEHLRCGFQGSTFRYFDSIGLARGQGSPWFWCLSTANCTLINVILYCHSIDSSFRTTLRFSRSPSVSSPKNKNDNIYLCPWWEDERRCCMESNVPDMQKLLCKWHLSFPTKLQGPEYSTLRALQSGQLMKWICLP